MKKIYLLVALMLFACRAQEDYYLITFGLNNDAYEYIMFIAEVDSNENPFADTLYNFPEQEWAQHLLGSFLHDSLYVERPDSAVVEYIPIPADTLRYLAICFFAKTSAGYYSDKTYNEPTPIPIFYKPGSVGFTVKKMRRWK